MSTINQVVILAGGKGKRLGNMTKDTPKPMIDINGKPFLEHLINDIVDNNFTEVILLLGYKAEKIVNYFGDGSKFGINIKYSIRGEDSKTGTRLREASRLLDKRFLLLYCDNYMPINLDKYIEYYNNNNISNSVIVYSNKDKFTKNNLLVKNNLVVEYDKSRSNKNLNGVNVGYYIIDRDTVIPMMPKYNFKFEDVIIDKLVNNNNLLAYVTGQRYCSIGDLKRLPMTIDFFRDKKSIFLDRDGVINRRPPKADYVKSWDEFEFLPGVLDAIKLLTSEGYNIYIISNQPGIARGKMTTEDLNNIHKNMITTIENNEGKISKIYYCPHGWNDGCDCRKPNPGMFYQVSREYNIDLRKCIYIGDDLRDKQAGDAVGLTTILVNNKSLNELVLEIIKNDM